MMDALTAVLSLLGLVLVVILTAFCAITAYLHYQHRKFAHLPRPEPFNFYLGNFLELYNVVKHGMPMDLIFIEWYHRCGPIYVYFIFHQHTVIVLDPESVKELFMNPKVYKPPQLYDSFGYVWGERYLGRSLVTEPHYEVWKPRRSIYDPSFKKAHLKTLIPAFNKCADRMVEKLTPLADGVTLVPMKKEFSLVTLDVIGTVAFGSDFRTWYSDIPELKKKGGDGEGKVLGLLSHTLEAIELSYYYPLYQYIHPFKAESYRKSVRAIRKIGRECIQRRISAIENEEVLPNDILTQIIKSTISNDNITVEELVDDFVTFYTAGQETTSNLLSFALVVMIQHPAILTRVVDEVTEVLGDRQFVTSEDVEKLEYTLQVLQETLRLYPPATFVFKATPEEVKLRGYRIPKDTMIVADNFAACRLPENFEDPEEFDPSRFASNRPKPDPFVYFPFSRGHRSCLGQVFALIEARIILARLLQKFQFSLPADFKLEIMSQTTLLPKGLVPCTLKLVQNE